MGVLFDIIELLTNEVNSLNPELVTFTYFKNVKLQIMQNSLRKLSL